MRAQYAKKFAGMVRLSSRNRLEDCPFHSLEARVKIFGKKHEKEHGESLIRGDGHPPDSKHSKKASGQQDGAQDGATMPGA